MTRNRSARLVGLAIAAVVACVTPDRSAAGELKLGASGARLKADVSFLADDEREGRGIGTRGIDAAADYIADAFKQAGLKPAPGADGYFQPFTVGGDLRLADDAHLALAGPADRRVVARPEADFVTVSSRGGTARGPLVFAGYGITAKDDKLKLDYDDYAGVDVKGKVVLLFRSEPQMDDPASPFGGKELTDHATFRTKAANAADHGAAGLILVNNRPNLKGGKDDLIPDGGAGRLPLPFAMATRTFADSLLAAAGQPTLQELEAKIDDGLKPQTRELAGWTADLALETARKPIATRNVVGVLEGSGPTADETIVVGAHYDHLGRGGSGSLAFGSHEIHNGADDNASGTALVIELARRLASRRLDPLPRRIVFMAFSGEERGLLGSAHYVSSPLYPLKDTAAMVNFDMVGRLNPQRELTIFGAGSTSGLDALVDALGRSQGLAIRRVPGTGGEFFASDHASFYQKSIPVLFAFTGNHKEYHRPTDDVELINFEGMARIANLGELLLLDLAERPERPTFTKLPTGAGRNVGAVRSGSGAYLGTRPAYGESDTPGVKLDGVSEGSPAEKAGLRGGDVIVRFAGKDVKDIEDFMEGLGKQKPGDEVEVVVKRAGQETAIKVTLGSRPSATPRD